MDNPFDKPSGIFRQDQVSEEDRLRLKQGNWNTGTDTEGTPKSSSKTVLWGNEVKQRTELTADVEENKANFTQDKSAQEPEAPKVGPEVERMNRKNAILAEYEGLESNIPASSEYWKI